MREVVKEAGQRVGEIEMLSEREYKQIVYDWNDTGRDDCPLGQPVHLLFQSIVHSSPDAVAVSYNDSSFSYRALNVGANRLAHFLRLPRPRSGTRSSDLLPPSPHLILSLLAIVKSGAAYLP